jgi:hypothetical protein
VIVLLIVLVAPAAALHISDIKSQQVTGRSRALVCAGKRSNASTNELVKTVRTKLIRLEDELEQMSEPDVKGLDPPPLDVDQPDWSPPKRSFWLHFLYVSSWIIDVVVTFLDGFSVKADEMGSTSIYSVLKNSSDCADKFKDAMLGGTVEDSAFNGAVECITEDMDRCVVSKYTLDLWSVILRGVQSFADSFLSYMEFRHSIKETKDGVSRLSGSMTNLGKMSRNADETSQQLLTFMKILCRAQNLEKQCEDAKNHFELHDAFLLKSQDSCAEKADGSSCTKKDGLSGKCNKKICRGERTIGEKGLGPITDLLPDINDKNNN